MLLPDTEPIPVQPCRPAAGSAPRSSVPPTDPTLIDGFRPINHDEFPPDSGAEGHLPDGNPPDGNPPDGNPPDGGVDFWSRWDGEGTPPGTPPPVTPAPVTPAPHSPDGPPPPGPDADGGGGVLDGHWAQTSRVTRLLCATAHLHGEYAEAAAGALLDPSFTAIAPSWGLDPVALAQHAKQACDRRKERDSSLRYCLAAMVGVPLVLVGMALTRGLPPFNVALAVVVVTMSGLAMAWYFVFQHYELIRRSVVDVVNPDTSPRDLAPSLDVATRRRLEDLADSDTVVFGGYQPFVGCGVTLDSWTICVDVTDDGTGGPLPFDALQVHEHLLSTVPDRTPGGLWAAPRLFVAGTAAKAVPGLVPAPHAPDTWPASRLGDEILRRYTLAPTETARTYACLAVPAWQGEVVLSILTRAELAGSKLFLEGRAHALLPPKPAFRESKFVPKHGWRAHRAVAEATAPVFLALLLNSFTRKLELVKATRAFKRNRRRMRKELAEGHPFNYGASSSLREDVADPSELKYYATVDEVLSYRMLKRLILTTIEDFLVEHAVDVEDFRRQAAAALAETTVHLHDVASSGDSFGPKNTVTVRDMTPTPG